MKVFLISKEFDNNLPKFATNIKLSTKDAFNYIIINNPKNSKFIYSIYDIKFAINTNIELVKLFSCEEVNNEIHYENGKAGALNIIPTKEFSERNGSLKLKEVNIKTMDGFNICEDKFMILLPEGSLIIQFEKEIKEVEINLNIKEDGLE